MAPKLPFLKAKNAKCVKKKKIDVSYLLTLTWTIFYAYFTHSFFSFAERFGSKSTWSIFKPPREGALWAEGHVPKPQASLT